MLSFLKKTENYKNIIYVLDRLLQISIDGEAINRARRIDLPLYKILNTPKINQEIIHLGVLPVVRENGGASEEFARFINNLWMYMEYDINTDSLWAKTSGDASAQKNIYENIATIRKDILKYLHNKNMISNDDFSAQLNYKVKNFAE